MKIGTYRLIGFFSLLIVAIVLFSVLDTEPTQPEVASSAPTEAELRRLDNNEIIYYPSDAVKVLQTALNAEGYIVRVDGIMGSETYLAALRWQQDVAEKR